MFPKALPDEPSTLESIHEGHVAVHKDQGVRTGNRVRIELSQLPVLLDERGALCLNIIFNQIECFLSIEAVVDDMLADIELVLQNSFQSLDIEYLVVYDEDLLPNSWLKKRYVYLRD